MKKGITLIAALAVVLAITSGAFAANHYLITSSGQIKSGVIDITDLSSKARTALKGQKGSKGATGATGASRRQGRRPAHHRRSGSSERATRATPG